MVRFVQVRLSAICGDGCGMNPHGQEKTIHRLFKISVVGKAVDGVLEIIGGALLFFVTPDQIGGLLRALTQHELSEDPHDLIAHFLLRSVQHLSSHTQFFAAMFLLWHGVVKVGLVVGLLRRHLWAYPTAMVAFGMFLAYQLYRYSHTGSVWLLALSGLDVLVVGLTGIEYQHLRRQKDQP
jgi:uncharacterized membrane protein